MSCKCSRRGAQHCNSTPGNDQGWFFGCVRGWFRVLVVGGQLYAHHLGYAYGVRDVFWILLLLRVIETHDGPLPDVDFVVAPNDVSHLLRSKYVGWGDARLANATHPLTDAEAVPFMLGFSSNPAFFLEVSVPDNSFFGWPSSRLEPHWKQLNDPDVTEWPWARKRGVAIWRGHADRQNPIR